MTGVRSRGRRWRSARRWALAGLAVVAVTVGIPLLVEFRRPRPQPPPVPEPNGYEALLDAAGRIAGPPPVVEEGGGAAFTDAEALRPWVEANREALRRAEQALDLPSGVPLTFTPADNAIIHRDLAALRNLGRLMLADAVVAHEEGRLDDAARSALDAVRLARNASRNGLTMHRLVGLAIEESAGLEGLRRIRDDLGEARCRAIARELLGLDAARPDVDRAIALDRDWAEATMPRGVRVARAVVPSVRWKLDALLAPATDALRVADRRNAARARLLAVELAILAHRSRHGRLPDRLDALVPEFLPRVPADPFADGPLRYRPDEDGDGYRLYSIGPDGSDDGGMPYPKGSDWSKTPGDLGVDLPGL